MKPVRSQRRAVEEQHHHRDWAPFGRTIEVVVEQLHMQRRDWIVAVPEPRHLRMGHLLVVDFALVVVEDRTTSFAAVVPVPTEPKGPHRSFGRVADCNRMEEGERQKNWDHLIPQGAVRKDSKRHRHQPLDPQMGTLSARHKS